METVKNSELLADQRLNSIGLTLAVSADPYMLYNHEDCCFQSADEMLLNKGMGYRMRGD